MPVPTTNENLDPRIVEAIGRVGRDFLYRKEYLYSLSLDEQRQFGVEMYSVAEVLMQSIVGDDFSFKKLPLWATERVKTKSGYVMYGRRGDFLNEKESGMLSIRFVRPGEELTGLTLARQNKRKPFTVCAVDMFSRRQDASMFFYSASFKGNVPLAREIVLTAIESCRNDIFVYSHAASSKLSDMRYPIRGGLLEAYKTIMK